MEAVPSEKVGWTNTSYSKVRYYIFEQIWFVQAHCGTKPPFCRGRRTAAFRSQTSRRKKTFQVDELHRNRSPNQAAADAPPVAAAAAAHVALVSLPTRRAIVFQP